MNCTFIEYIPFCESIKASHSHAFDVFGNENYHLDEWRVAFKELQAEIDRETIKEAPALLQKPAKQRAILALYGLIACKPSIKLSDSRIEAIIDQWFFEGSIQHAVIKSGKATRARHAVA